MTSRKQKHAMAVEKREKLLATNRELGLAALAKDQQDRERQELEAWQKQHDEKHSWKRRLVECPHCRIELAKIKKHTKTKESI